MAYISIRDLQKISGEKISSLRGPTPVKSGNRTIAILIPVKPADTDRLAGALKKAEELAKGRDPAEDDAALKAMGIDPTNWDDKAVETLTEDWRKL